MTALPRPPVGRKPSILYPSSVARQDADQFMNCWIKPTVSSSTLGSFCFLTDWWQDQDRIKLLMASEDKKQKHGALESHLKATVLLAISKGCWWVSLSGSRLFLHSSTWSNYLFQPWFPSFWVEKPHPLILFPDSTLGISVGSHVLGILFPLPPWEQLVATAGLHLFGIGLQSPYSEVCWINPWVKVTWESVAVTSGAGLGPTWELNWVWLKNWTESSRQLGLM